MRVLQEEDTLSYSSETGRTLNCLLSPLLYRLLSLGEIGLGEGCLWSEGIWICHLQELEGVVPLSIKKRHFTMVVGFNGKSPFLLG